jgi:hypothetical protein
MNAQARTWALAVLAIVALPICAFAQNPSYLENGIPSFSVPGSQVAVPLGFVTATNGHLHFEIPIESVPERNGDPLVTKLTFDNTTLLYNINVTGPGWLTQYGTRDVGGVSWDTSPGPCDSNYPEGNSVITSNWRFTDMDGTVHAINNAGVFVQSFSSCTTAGGVQDPNTGTPSTHGGDWENEGYYFAISNYGGNVEVWAPDGSIVANLGSNGGSGKDEDTNGNYIYPSPGITKDLLGRVPVTIGGTVLEPGPITVKTSTGTTATYTINYETVYYTQSAGQVGSVIEVSSIVLPDGSQYSFNYDSGTTGTHYGDLTSMTLPSGGTVSYTYTTVLDYWSGQDERYVSSATFGGGTWNFQYVVTGSGNNFQTTTTVTSPARKPSASGSTINDTTVYVTYPGTPYVQSVKYYSGSSTLLKTLTVAYSSGYLPTNVTTTLNDTGQVSQVQYQWLRRIRSGTTKAPVRGIRFARKPLRMSLPQRTPSSLRP